MAARFVNVDRETQMLLPPDLRDWVAKDDLVNFVVDAVESCDLSKAKVNLRGSGSEQYPPAMMLGLLIYSYAHRMFSSRTIEKATYWHVSLRYICGGQHHPDHDTIAKFRRENGELLEECFLQVLELARELKAFGKLGVVSVDGTKLAARSSRDANRTQSELETEMATLQEEIKGLLAEAEKADAQPVDKRAELAEKLQDKQGRRAALQEAKVQLEQKKAAARKARQADDEVPPSDQPSPPTCRARGEGAKETKGGAKTASRGEVKRINLVEPESELMRNAHGDYLQAYNVQLVVAADGCQLICGKDVTNQGNDRRALAGTLQTVPETYREEIDYALGDTGYDNADMIEKVEREMGLTVLCPPQSKGTPKRDETYRVSAERRRRQDLAEAMRERLKEPDNVVRYKRRSATIEPVIGVLKNVMGFKRFSMFGRAKAQLELTLLSVAYNLRRLAQKFTPVQAV